jgi:hypothetical protein
MYFRDIPTSTARSIADYIVKIDRSAAYTNTFKTCTDGGLVSSHHYANDKTLILSGTWAKDVAEHFSIESLQITVEERDMIEMNVRQENEANYLYEQHRREQEYMRKKELGY